MRRAAALILLPAPLLLTAPALAGCGHGCTEIGCSDAASISLPADLKPGRYTFDVEADGMSWTCEGTIPVDAQPSCSGWDVALAHDGTTLRVIDLAWAPATSITVRMRRDGVELADRTFEPSYEVSRPNDEDCEPVCQVASHDLAQEEP